MHFVGDESLEARLVSRLEAAGHTVLSIHGSHTGISDAEVLGLSVQHDWPVITNDRDFGDLVFRQGKTAVGVILLRFGQTPTLEKAEALVAWLDANAHRVRGHYVVLGPRLARVRPLTK